MPKILHNILSDHTRWEGDNNAFKNYIKTDNFTKDQYIKFLSGVYTDDDYNLVGTAKILKNSKFNTKENNDKVISNILKHKDPPSNKVDDFYWKSKLIGDLLKNLKHSPKSIDNIIDTAKKQKSSERVKNLLYEITESDELNKKHIKKLINETDFISDGIIQHSLMDSELFKDILKKRKTYKNLPSSLYNSKFLDSKNALDILYSTDTWSARDLGNILNKIPKGARKDYIHKKLGITGGEKMPEERYGARYYVDEWASGPGRTPHIADILANSKHLTPEAVEHIKKYGSFDEKYNLFTNENIDPKHAVEMAVKWANSEEGYDEDELKEKIKEETSDNIWETYSDDARDRAMEDYSMDQYLNDIGDDEVSKTLFDKGYEHWKKDWIKENKDLNAPNPNFDPNEPESEDNPKTILFNADEYDTRYDVEDHPNFVDYDSDAESAFEEAKRSADHEPLYDGYDESIREGIDQYVYDLRDEDLKNWTETPHLLPDHVYDKLKSPFKDKDNPTENELAEALNHPLKITRNAAAKNSKLTPKLIDQVLKGDDDDAKARVLSNPNVTPDQLMTAIKKSKDTDVLSNALKNIKVRPEHIQEAINRHAKNDEVISSVFDSPSANDEHVKSFLNIAKQSEDPLDYNVKSVLDSKFNISPEDVKFIYNNFDQTANYTGLSRLLEHHSSTKDIIDQALNHRYQDVKNSAKNALDRRFPQTADPVKVKIGTHPLRILRDLVTEQGGTVSKGKLKSMGVNADKFSSIFKPNGTISAEDVQKIIDAAPSKTYNTSHSTWTGGQRHSNEASKVFQLNYTQEHLDQMHKEGVLDTFKKMYDVSFRSGHPVKNNTIGWVRYTGTPETGFHIDEIQSDLGQSIIQQTIQQAKHAMENEGISQEEAERAITNAKRDFPDDHLKKINTILFGDKHPSEVLHEGFKEYIRNRGFGDSPIHIWQPESKAPISGMSTSTKISPSDADDIIESAKKGRVDRNGKALIAWGQQNKLAPASLKEITSEHLDQIGNQYKEFANKHREQHSTDPELPVQLPVHMVEGYGKIPKAMGYKESFYGKLPTQSGKEHLAQELNFGLTQPGKATYEDKVRKQEELDKGLKGDWQKEGYTIKEADPGKYYDYAIEAHHPEHGLVGRARFKAHYSSKHLIPGDIMVKPEHQRKGIGSAMYQHAKKVYAPILNRASHQTLAANAMWEKMGHTFGKSEKNKEFTHDEIERHFENVGEFQFYNKGYETFYDDNTKTKKSRPKPEHTKLGLPFGNYKLLTIPINKLNSDSEKENPTKKLYGKFSNEFENRAQHYSKLKTKAPAIIVKPHDNIKDNYEIIDGIHRARAAYLRGDSHIDAYVYVPDKIKKSESTVPTVLYHYSKQPGLKEIDPKQMGTGVPGEFRSKFDPSKITDFPHASFHYIQDKPEDMVRAAARAKYVLKLNPDQKLYDITEDKDSLVREAVKENQGAWNYEAVLNKIKNAGYYGIMAGKHEHPVIANTVQLFYKHPVEQELKP